MKLAPHFNSCLILPLLLLAGMPAETPLAAAEASGTVVQQMVKLRVPKSGKDKRVKGPADAVSFSVFIPKGVKVIRGAVINPFYEETVKQQHWRAVVAQWDFALIGMSYFGVKGDQFGVTTLDGLKQLGAASGHPELANAPLCFIGMSAGAGMSTRLAEALPERTLAVGPVCLEVGPRDEASYRIPMITVFGERDGKQYERLATRLADSRQQHALFATAVQWGRKHEFYRANNLVMVLFDRAIAAQYPSDTTPANAPIKLKRLAEQQGWLADTSTWDQPTPTIAAYDNYQADRTAAAWLPDAYTAAVWQSMVAKNPPLKITAPNGMGGGKPFLAHQADAPITVTANVKKAGELKSLRLYNGDQLLADLSTTNPNTKVRLPKGIHALRLVGELTNGDTVLSPPNTIVVHQ